MIYSSYPHDETREERMKNDEPADYLAGSSYFTRSDKVKNKLETLFLHTKMTWKTVVAMAVGCGAAVGLLMVPDILKDTSFQQPGISFEFWIFTALLIILNCEKPLEAGLKTFVFFLISQPLIYLVQVPFSRYHWELLRYYPHWGMITLLTLPGAALGWYVKKDRWYSVLLLSVLNAILCMELPVFAGEMAGRFPRFLISTVFIVFELFFFNLLLFKGKRRVMAYALTLVMLAASAVYAVQLDKNTVILAAASIEEGTAPYELVGEPEGVTVTVDDDVVRVELKNKDYRRVDLRLRDSEGRTVTMTLDYSEEEISWLDGGQTD